MTLTQHEAARLRQQALYLEEGQSAVIIQPSNGHCPPGQHDLQVTSVNSPSILSPSATMVYCTKCPFHYFPVIPQDETDNTREHPISDD